jgi:uncharacterized BrkB/YihY/UPF0761 family membrane protein
MVDPSAAHKVGLPIRRRHPLEQFNCFAVPLPLSRWSMKLIGVVGLLLKEAGRGWYKHRAQRLGAALAFYTTLALAPLTIIAIAVAGYFFGEESARGGIVDQIEHLVGKEGATTIEALIQKAGEPARLVFMLPGRVVVAGSKGRALRR